MAAYVWEAAEQTVQQVSPDLIRDAFRVTARAVDSDVVFSLLFAPYPTDPTGTVIWTSELIAGQLADWAGKWNTNRARPGVLGIGLTQDTDALGQLREVALVVVGSRSGKSQAQLTLYPHDFFPDTFAVRVDATRAQLASDEAGGAVTE